MSPATVIRVQLQSAVDLRSRQGDVISPERLTIELLSVIVSYLGRPVMFTVTTIVGIGRCHLGPQVDRAASAGHPRASHRDSEDRLRDG